MIRRLSDYGLLGFAALSSLVALALIYFGQTQYEREVAQMFHADRERYDAGDVLRSSEQLIESLGLLTQLPLNDTQINQVQASLELSRTTLQQPAYRTNYACVDQVTPKLDETLTTLKRGFSQDILASTPWSETLQCQHQIVLGQQGLRNQIAGEFIDQSISKKRWFTAAIVLTYLLGILLWIVHERQRLRLISMLRDKLRWQRRAETDHLTGAYNRLALEEALESCTRNTGTVQTLVMLYDIDYFKSYNDHYGHVRGDDAIKRVVGAIDTILRAEDRQFRYGGEEFVILTELAPQQDPEPIALRTLEAVRALEIEHQLSPHGKITISLGLHLITPEDSDPAEIISKADQHLYRAKSEGRNCYRA